MTDDELLAEYRERHSAILMPLASKLQVHIQEALTGIPRVDRVSARAKSPDRFVGKAMKRKDDGGLKYEHPFEQIQDLVGARVIVFYKQDVDAVSDAIDRYFRRIEGQDLVPDSVNEFGYVGRHFILAVPEDVIEDAADRSKTPDFFELQVKTLFQHAWSEAEHDLAYKPTEPLSPLQQRQIAFTAAQAWGADQIFQQLHAELGSAQA
jgi:ppGpp synthetase/RelA/SpoT-type nucleotidyltranferase